MPMQVRQPENYTVYKYTLFTTSRLKKSKEEKDNDFTDNMMPSEWYKRTLNSFLPAWSRPPESYIN